MNNNKTSIFICSFSDFEIRVVLMQCNALTKFNTYSRLNISLLLACVHVCAWAHKIIIFIIIDIVYLGMENTENKKKKETFRRNGFIFIFILQLLAELRYRIFFISGLFSKLPRIELNRLDSTKAIWKTYASAYWLIGINGSQLIQIWFFSFHTREQESSYGHLMAFNSSVNSEL